MIKVLPILALPAFQRTRSPVNTGRTHNLFCSQDRNRTCIYTLSVYRSGHLSYLTICTRGGNRTLTDVSVHKILSLAWLPITPLEHCSLKTLPVHETRKWGDVVSTIMRGLVTLSHRLAGCSCTLAYSVRESNPCFIRERDVS